jgi:hypothetical protein
MEPWRRALIHARGASLHPPCPLRDAQETDAAPRYPWREQMTPPDESPATRGDDPRGSRDPAAPRPDDERASATRGATDAPTDDIAAALAAMEDDSSGTDHGVPPEPAPEPVPVPEPDPEPEPDRRPEPEPPSARTGSIAPPGWEDPTAPPASAPPLSSKPAALLSRLRRRLGRG